MGRSGWLALGTISVLSLGYGCTWNGTAVAFCEGCHEPQTIAPGSGGGGRGGEAGAGGVGGAAQGGGGAGGGPECVTAADCGEETACAAPVCTAGVCATQAAPAGTTCQTGFCDGQGACVECLVGVTCPSGVCSGGVCQPPTCTDGLRNGAELAADCGGGECPGCGNGTACTQPVDCLGVCADGRCACATPPDHLVISEVQTRGNAGEGDEFIEIYNPSPTHSVEIDSPRVIVDGVVVYSGIWIRFPPNTWMAIGGPQASGPMTERAAAPMFDDGSGVVELRSGSTLVDALCYCTGCRQILSPSCEGKTFVRPDVPALQPQSIARRPAHYNCMDTDDNADDFYVELQPTSESR